MDLYTNFISQFKKAISDANRDYGDVELIAVSKTKTVAEIRDVINQGHLSFGENKLQEVEEKWIELKKIYPAIRLHFIGAIQSRKINAIHETCDVIHSLDRMKIVKKFNEIETTSGKKREYFIQINTGNEPQKSGVFLSEADSFISQCQSEFNINIVGLMCIPPIKDSPSKHFSDLNSLSHNFNLKYLSMGMSSDYKDAIKCGSTHVRIGTHIFGERI